MIKKTYLPARVLGMPASSDALFKTLNSEPSFQAVLLKRQYSLSIAEIPKPDEAIDALAWKLMGFAGETRKFNVEEHQDGVVQPGVGRRARDRIQEGRHQAAGTALGYGERRSQEAARRGRARLDRPERKSFPPAPPSAPAPPPIELDLPTFAERVKAAARVCPTGRFGDNKVFIAHVWRALQSDPAFRTMDLSAFKERLAEANNARLLDLSRADLVQAMDPEDVRESEVHYLNATFHFVRI